MSNDTIEAASAEPLRHALVNQLMEHGLIRTGRVEEAMRTVPRHMFVPQAPLEKAYANATVDIKLDAGGASISCASQPGIVAMMLEQLQVEPGHKILELGAGTGYNAGLLAYLADPTGHVTTIDVDDDLVEGARTSLAAAGIDNVTVILGDGALGHADNAPYDRVIATVGAHAVPHAWLDQLAPGGRLLTPLRLRGTVARSIAFEQQDGAWRSLSSEMNTFMPLRQGIADDPRRMVPVTSDGTVTLVTPYPSSTACSDQATLTYLTRRKATHAAPDGASLYEFGVIGHGPGRDALAEQVAESVRTWDHEYRGREVTFEIQPLDSPPPAQGPGRFTFSNALNRILIEWR
ncbi:methyltransferase, FxLD system [Actinomadura sp. NPDC048955]|uniref:methyltransferase, FxLD system n=1 Tax=Actinomadura sp. NPDC048955 TaxID=3158228 RepID=UPI0033DAB48E